MKKILILLLAAALCTGMLSGCGSETTTPAPPASTAESNPAATAASGTLNIYTTVSDLQYNALVGAFQKKYPGIEINYTQAGAGESKARIKSEAANPQGDVMFGGLVYADTPAYSDLFEKYVSPGDAKMTADFKNTTGVLTYHDTQIPCLWVNDELEKKAGVTIKSYTDLLNPALKGQIASADPTESSSAWNQLQCILTDFGGYDKDAAWEYIGKLMPSLVITDGSSAVYKGVYNGEYTVGMTYEPACVQMLSEGAEGVHIVYPTEGVTSISFGSAIIKDCKNPENAKLFIDFLISDEGQTIYNQCGARQANATLKIDNKWLPDLSTLNYKSADTAALAENQAQILQKWTDLTKKK
jgi:iron(III) transport system substrate-binding protein